VSQALFPNQTQLPGVVPNVSVILIVKQGLFARISAALKNQIHATHHLVDLELLAWLTISEILFAG
jgi:hypothetical protein